MIALALLHSAISIKPEIGRQKNYKKSEFADKTLTQGGRRSRPREDRRSGQRTGGQEEDGEGAPQGETGVDQVREGLLRGTGVGVRA